VCIADGYTPLRAMKEPDQPEESSDNMIQSNNQNNKYQPSPATLQDPKLVDAAGKTSRSGAVRQPLGQKSWEWAEAFMVDLGVAAGVQG
jgi:hypothetical protein